jgi:serine/threonine protein kinase
MYDLVGKTLGKYQIIELQHQTAVTEVYQAFAPGMNRYVVISVLKAEFIANETIMKRFLDQNDIAAKVQHPNLLPLIDFGEENGIYFRVLMNGADGGWRENKKWFNNSEAVVRLFSQISSALSHIHKFGYSYLNLRPNNIFFEDQQKPMLGDFGIAVAPEFSKTDPYCSPEASRNEPVDQRADIYALGILLYEILTGAPPDMNRYVSLRSLRPDLPQEVEKVVLKSLSDRPEDRFQSVETFQASLESAFHLQSMTPSPVAVPVNQKQKKGKGWLIALVIALIALCLGAVAVWAIFRDDGDMPNEAPIELPVEETVEAPPPPEDEVVVVPTVADPGEGGPTRPEWQLPDVDLPELSEIPICNSLYPALGVGMIGLIGLKSRKKADHKDRDKFQD